MDQIREKKYEVLPPYGHPTREVLPQGSCLDTLDGKTICGTGGTFHGAETFQVIAELLAKKYPTAKFVGQDITGEFDKTKYPTEQDFLDAIPGLLKQYKCDAVIVGNGC